MAVRREKKKVMTAMLHVLLRVKKKRGSRYAEVSHVLSGDTRGNVIGELTWRECANRFGFAESGRKIYLLMISVVLPRNKPVMGSNLRLYP